MLEPVYSLFAGQSYGGLGVLALRMRAGMFLALALGAGLIVRGWI